MNRFIPDIGTTGLYHLLSPFSELLVPNIPYTCVAIRKIVDILSSGGDPFLEYYSPYALDATAYKNDVVEDAYIISLQSSDGTMLYVPSTYMTSYPDVGGVPYSVIALAISLGPIPDSLDLTYLKSKLIDVVKEIVGIETSVNTVAVSPPALIALNDSNALEAARTAKITTVETDYALYINTKAQLVTALGKITQYDDYLRDLRTRGII